MLSTVTAGAIATTSAGQKQLVKMYESIPSPFFPLDQFPSAVWGHYGVYGFNTLVKSLLFDALAVFWWICLCVWEISYWDVNLENCLFICQTSRDKFKKHPSVPLICNLSDTSSTSAKFLVGPIRKHIFQKATLTDKHMKREFNLSA